MALEHLNATPSTPSRVVVLGAGGFVGGAVIKRIARSEIPTLSLGRPNLDLLADSATKNLVSALNDGDTLVIVSAKAPCKSADMLIDNLRMLGPIEAALGAVDLAQVIYVSSDAVYADLTTPLDEASPAAPGSFHGVMHLAREITLQEASMAPFAIIRPTLIYGASDPHNGYGPNRFRRLAASGGDIVLFGEGEERRDHVWIDDVSDLITRMIMHRSRGVLNAATGSVTSFREAAEIAVALSGSSSAIKPSPRVGPMPHNGYRPFNPTATLSAFPDFRYTSLSDGLKLVLQQVESSTSR